MKALGSVLADRTIWMADIYNGLLKAETAGNILEPLHEQLKHGLLHPVGIGQLRILV